MPTLTKRNEILHTMKNGPIWGLFWAFAFAAVSVFAANAVGQNGEHSPGWVVLPVEEYRALHERAYPVEREPEPPPVEATLTRVDYDLRVVAQPTAGSESTG